MFNNISGKQFLVVEEDDMYYVFKIESSFIHGESDITTFEHFSEKINRRLKLDATLGSTITAIEKMPELDITDREVLNLISGKVKENP